MFKINQEKLRNDLKSIEFDLKTEVVIEAYCQFGFFGVFGNLTQGDKNVKLKIEVDEQFSSTVDSNIYSVMSESAGRIQNELKSILESEYQILTKFNRT